MIARATPTLPARPAAPGTPSLVGNKRAQGHRFYLTGGRVLEGDLHRSPGSRLADHLSTLKGFISVTNARCLQSGHPFGYIVLNQDAVLFIEELAVTADTAAATAASAYTAGV
ncbi:hypothetical protein [Longimicrobium sp.]|uniref:hypothetical protein n=1 Tax=Longimicrobium sp. TaxID=2029185 RepID=UPI003B3BA3C5